MTIVCTCLAACLQKVAECGGNLITNQLAPGQCQGPFSHASACHLGARKPWMDPGIVMYPSCVEKEMKCKVDITLPSISRNAIDQLSI